MPERFDLSVEEGADKPHTAFRKSIVLRGEGAGCTDWEDRERDSGSKTNFKLCVLRALKDGWGGVE